MFVDVELGRGRGNIYFFESLGPSRVEARRRNEIALVRLDSPCAVQTSTATDIIEDEHVDFFMFMTIYW